MHKIFKNKALGCSTPSTTVNISLVISNFRNVPLVRYISETGIDGSRGIKINKILKDIYPSRGLIFCYIFKLFMTLLHLTNAYCRNRIIGEIGEVRYLMHTCLQFAIVGCKQLNLRLYHLPWSTDFFEVFFLFFFSNNWHWFLHSDPSLL